MVVKKIPRDHMGLYACEPLNHGIQQGIEEEYKPDIKTNLMSGKIEGRKIK